MLFQESNSLCRAIVFRRTARPSMRPSSKSVNPVRRLNETPGLKDTYEEITIRGPDEIGLDRHQVTLCKRLAGASAIVGFSSPATSKYSNSERSHILHLISKKTGLIYKIKSDPRWEQREKSSCSNQ